MAEDEDKDGQLKEITIKFRKMWSSSRGLYVAGQVAALPKNIAKSLIAEGVAEKE